MLLPPRRLTPIKAIALTMYGASVRFRSDCSKSCMFRLRFTWDSPSAVPALRWHDALDHRRSYMGSGMSEPGSAKSHTPAGRARNNCRYTYDGPDSLLYSQID